MLDTGDHAICEGPVRSRRIVHAVGRARNIDLVLGGLGIVGRVLVGAGIAPKNCSELAAREGVTHAELPRLVAVGVARDEAARSHVGHGIAVPIRVIYIGEDGGRTGRPDLHGYLVALRRDGRSIVHGRPTRVAADDFNQRAVRGGNFRAALVPRAANTCLHLEVLVRRRRRKRHARQSLRQRERVRMDVSAKRRGQNARAHRERGHRLVVAPPVAPKIGAAVKRVPKVDLGARLQSSTAHGHRGEARVREPVVDRAHPTAFPAAVELAKPRDGSDVALVGADDGNALLVCKARDRRHRAVRRIQVDIPLGDDAAGRRVVYARGPRNGVADADVHLSDRRFT